MNHKRPKPLWGKFFFIKLQAENLMQQFLKDKRKNSIWKVFASRTLLFLCWEKDSKQNQFRSFEIMFYRLKVLKAVVLCCLKAKTLMIFLEIFHTWNSARLNLIQTLVNKLSNQRKMICCFIPLRLHLRFLATAKLFAWSESISLVNSIRLNVFCLWRLHWKFPTSFQAISIRTSSACHPLHSRFHIRSINFLPM